MHRIDRPAQTGEGFLTRWSRRKQDERQVRELSQEENDAIPVPGPGDAREPPGPDNQELGDEAAPVVRDLPDIDSLGHDSDFSAFMQAGVDAALRKQALRRLWRLDPAFSHLDGLVEYGEDYTGSAKAEGVVRTAWRLGRGIAGADGDEGILSPDEPDGELSRENRPGVASADRAADQTSEQYDVFEDGTVRSAGETSGKGYVPDD